MTYNQVNQVITYTYVILNNGNVTLSGPFTVADDKVATVNCTQPADNLLSPNKEMSCTSSYSIVQDNLNTDSVTNNAIASNGTTTSNIATATINKTSAGAAPSTTLVSGTDVTHRVENGEWLWQIARCYGANPRDVINANRQLYNPSDIPAGITVTVPDIGSAGTIYGPPCISWHTVASGDTWDSIAQHYGADANLLREANSRGLIPGDKVRVLVGPYNYP
jgi:LysM repeat protein